MSHEPSGTGGEGFGTEPSKLAALLAVGGVNLPFANHEDLDQAFLRRGLHGSRRSTKAAVLAHCFCFSGGGGSWHQHI